MAAIKWVRDDGGRAKAGFKGEAYGDCLARALALATGEDYRSVYDTINNYAKTERLTKKRLTRSNARTGVHMVTARKVANHYGGVWVPTMGIGTGTTVHLRTQELPPGRIVTRVSKHFAAVIDGVLHDTHDCSRDGTRAVYGYWHFPRQPSGKKLQELHDLVMAAGNDHHLLGYLIASIATTGQATEKDLRAAARSARTAGSSS